MSKQCDEKWGTSQFGAAGWILLDRYRGADKSHRVECTTCGNQSTKKLSNIRQGKGCVYCYRRGSMTRIPDDVAFERMVKAGFTPKDREYPGIVDKWLCSCNQCGGDVWVTLNHAEAVGNAACPHICRTRRKERKKTATAARREQRRKQETREWFVRQAEKTAARESEVVSEMLARGYRPAESFPGEHHLWECICEACGEPFATTLHYVRKGKAPKGCHVQTYDSIRPAWVYVIEHVESGALKIGYAGDVEKRMKSFPGWTLHGTVELETGAQAFAVEQKALKLLRRAGIPPYAFAGRPCSGSTETLVPGRLSPAELLALAQALADGRRVRLG